MAINKKTKIRFVILSLILLTIIVFVVRSTVSFAEIIYFRNSACRSSNNVDVIIDQIQNDFGEKVIVRPVKIQMYENDENDTQEISELREKYNIIGVPTIIINGKEYTKEFTKEKLEKEICKKILFKSEVCI